MVQRSGGYGPQVWNYAPTRELLVYNTGYFVGYQSIAPGANYTFLANALVNITSDDRANSEIQVLETSGPAWVTCGALSSHGAINMVVRSNYVRIVNNAAGAILLNWAGWKVS